MVAISADAEVHNPVVVGFLDEVFYDPGWENHVHRILDECPDLDRTIAW